MPGVIALVGVQGDATSPGEWRTIIASAASRLGGTLPSFGSIAPRFLTILKQPLLAWAM
jgi:hypothetical protein